MNVDLELGEAETGPQVWVVETFGTRAPPPSPLAFASETMRLLPDLVRTTR